MEPATRRRLPTRVVLAYCVVTAVTIATLCAGYLMIARSIDQASAARANSDVSQRRIGDASDVLGYAVRIGSSASDSPTGQLSAEFAQSTAALLSADSQAQMNAALLRLDDGDRERLERLQSQTHEATQDVVSAASNVSVTSYSPNASRFPTAALVNSLAVKESVYVDAVIAEQAFFDAVSARAELDSRVESGIFVLLVLAVFGAGIFGAIVPAHRGASRSLEHSIRSQEQYARIGSEVARHVAERDRIEAEAQFQALFRRSTVGVALTDQRGWILDSNEALQEMLGYSGEELRGSKFGEWSIDIGAAAASQGASSERLYRRKNGTTLWVDQTSTAAPGSGDSGLATIWMVQDIEKRKNAERQLQFDASHDGLTGLHNRAFFDEAVERAVGDAKLREGTGFAICMLDVDRFKHINDTRGHATGDYVLAEVGRRLRSWAVGEVVVARYGGDEFAAFLPGITDAAAAVDAATQLGRVLEQPMLVAGMTLHVTHSFGVCLWNIDLPDADAIMRAADSATYRAKALGRSRVVTYDSGMAQYDNLRHRIGIELRGAIDSDQIHLVYQPIVSMPDRSCIGFEALARWDHPELGSLSPAIFIPVAEQVGLMSAIGAKVLRQACDQLAAWQRREGADSLKLNVNVSPQQMADPAFPSIVADCLSRSGADPKCIALELTETAMLDERGATSETLARLRQMGISIVLDDFGTGFSSLSHLQLLPMDALKIDQSFVKGPNEALASPAIVHALITMARTLGIGIVAEGVETEKQAALLNHMGCRAGQGFLFSKPLEPEAAFQFLIRSNESEALGQTS